MLPMTPKYWPDCWTEDVARSSRILRASRQMFRRNDMPKSVNKVIIVGNVGKDPEVKYTPSGVALAKFSVATNESFKDKSGEWQDRTEWHNVLAWQRLAEVVGEYVHKGTK